MNALAVLPLLALIPQTPTPLPVRAVTLFSSGVSFTLREGELTGSADIPLTFRTGQINDILKSLVLLDEKGQVRPAVYGSRDPIGRTLQSFAVDVTQPLSRAELLNRLRGTRVSVETAAGPLVGQIVGVEFRPGLEKAPPIELLTLLGDPGLQYVRLDEIKGIKLLDERLDKELRTALALLAAGSDDKRRQVTLHFAGESKRRVRVGYVTEAPLWKVSYRLILGGSGINGVAATGNAKPYLQGWALVENTSDEDWEGVKLSLVSGRPISFIQDLYQPLYLPRPVVAPDNQASPLPQVSEGAVERKRDGEAVLNRSIMGRAGVGVGGRGGGMAGPGGNLDIADAPNAAVSGTAFRESVTADASGEATGELFAYTIKTPVSLPRQQAAMIPIVTGEIAGEKLSLYNPDTIHPTIPMNALRLKNDTGLFLKAGPVTLFDDGTYAGDALLPDIPPGDSRLVTYALDLTLTAERQPGGGSSVETSISIKRGVLSIVRRETAETLYTLRNKAEKPRTVLVEHPFDSARRLVQPTSFDERTPRLYRFKVTVPAGKSETLTVRTERPLSEEIGLLNGDPNVLSLHFQRKDGIPEKVKAALGDVLARRRKVQELQADAAGQSAEIQTIEQDQERVRKNMQALDRDSALYKRYVTQLDEQETRIQKLRSEVQRTRAAASEAERALRTFVDSLTVAP